jgi:hypothetical protein
MSRAWRTAAVSSRRLALTRLRGARLRVVAAAPAGLRRRRQREQRSDRDRRSGTPCRHTPAFPWHAAQHERRRAIAQ